MDSVDVPPGRCGFVLRPQDVENPGDYENIKSWHIDTEAVCCWLETWGEREHCIWHTKEVDKPTDLLAQSRKDPYDRFDGAKISNIDSDNELSFNFCGLYGANLFNADLDDMSLFRTDLRHADLEGVNLEESNIGRADVRYADLTEGSNLKNATARKTDFRNAVITNGILDEADFWRSDFRNANLQWASFRSSNLWDSELQHTNLYDSDFDEADLREANLQYADLEDASLVGTDLRSADLRNTRLYQTYFSDVRINSDTEFGDTCIYENPDELDDDWDDRWDATPTEAAVWTYRRLQDLHEKYALTERARHYHIRKEEAEKKRHREEGNWKEWAIYAINGFLSRHGERPWRVVRISLYVIAVWSLFFLLSGIRVPEDFSGTRTVGLELFSGISVPEPFGGTLVAGLDQVATSVYFSVVTFTTLGYGDLQPATGFAQALATIESFLGALLMAYLVFVLGRRTNW